MTADMIVQAADRATSSPFYLARPIRAWQAAHAASAEDTLVFLGATVDRRLGAAQQLARIALCRAPVSRADFLAISARFGVDPERLAALVREVVPPTGSGQ